jgi:SPP1 family predicted phage head-tail adaptor
MAQHCGGDDALQNGELDQRIVLQSLTETNIGGESTQSFATVATVWGRVISERGNESFASARVNAVETIRVRIHYREDVTDKWRIQWNSQNYGITYIDRSQRRKGALWLTCGAVGVE